MAKRSSSAVGVTSTLSVLFCFACSHSAGVYTMAAARYDPNPSSSGVQYRELPHATKRSSFDGVSKQPWHEPSDELLQPQHRDDKFYRLSNAVAAEKAGVDARERFASVASCDPAWGGSGVQYHALVGSEHEARRATIFTSVITLMNSTMGASMLVLPFGTRPSCMCAASARATSCLYSLVGGWVRTAQFAGRWASGSSLS